jgi:hypothetical protein
MIGNGAKIFQEKLFAYMSFDHDARAELLRFTRSFRTDAYVPFSKSFNGDAAQRRDVRTWIFGLREKDMPIRAPVFAPNDFEAGIFGFPTAVGAIVIGALGGGILGYYMLKV